MSILSGFGALSPQAQSSMGQQTYLAVKAVESNSDRFWAEREALKRERERERIRVPSYNADLSKAIYDFHHHISDMHYRHTACKLCRQHVKKIRDLSKKIDSAMK